MVEVSWIVGQFFFVKNMYIMKECSWGFFSIYKIKICENNISTNDRSPTIHLVISNCFCSTPEQGGFPIFEYCTIQQKLTWTYRKMTLPSLWNDTDRLGHFTQMRTPLAALIVQLQKILLHESDRVTMFSRRFTHLTYLPYPLQHHSTDTIILLCEDPYDIFYAVMVGKDIVLTVVTSHRRKCRLWCALYCSRKV